MRRREDLRSVLYVDDQPDIREVVELSLSLAPGLAVQLCESGERALAILAVSKPDLVLLDAMMPGMDGPTTLQRLRQEPRLANVPVIFMTAKALPQEIRRFHELGAAGVIPKPFDPMKLAENLYAIWEGLADGDTKQAE